MKKRKIITILIIAAIILGSFLFVTARITATLKSIEEDIFILFEKMDMLTEAVQATQEAEKTPDMVCIGNYKITAYCHCEKCCGRFADGITASGTVATQNRTAAVDPAIIPYGTKLYINGQEYIAEDCGSAIKENHIDLYFATHQEALQWGVQYYDVYIEQ